MGAGSGSRATGSVAPGTESRMGTIFGGAMTVAGGALGGGVGGAAAAAAATARVMVAGGSTAIGSDSSMCSLEASDPTAASPSVKKAGGGRMVTGWMGSWKMEAVSFTLLNSPSTFLVVEVSSCWENELTISFTLLNSTVEESVDSVTSLAKFEVLEAKFEVLEARLEVLEAKLEVLEAFLMFLKAAALIMGGGGGSSESLNCSAMFLTDPERPRGKRTSGGPVGISSVDNCFSIFLTLSRTLIGCSTTTSDSPPPR